MTYHEELYVTNTPLSLSVLIDYRSDGNFITSSLVSTLSLSVVKLASSISVKALDESPGTHIAKHLFVVMPHLQHAKLT